MQARQVLREKIVANIIYTAANETLKELLVGATDLPLDKLKERHTGNPPPAIFHWKFNSQEIVYRDIERTLSKDAARPFIATYARAMQSIRESDWKTITE